MRGRKNCDGKMQILKVLSTSENSRLLFKWLLTKNPHPVVIQADANVEKTYVQCTYGILNTFD